VYGTIPVSVGLLSNLVVLDVANNSLTGSIPINIGSMKAPHVLRLDGNRLTGTIPSGIGFANALTTVDLLGNELTGALPAAIGSLVNLKSLDLSQNRLDGTVPASFCALQGVGARMAFNNVWCDSEYAVNYENVASLGYGALTTSADQDPTRTYFVEHSRTAGAVDGAAAFCNRAYNGYSFNSSGVHGYCVGNEIGFYNASADVSAYVTAN
jgi:hypothetical protein